MQEDDEFKTSLGYVERPCLKINQPKRKDKKKENYTWLKQVKSL
jgi:hypothetical protein